MAAVDVVVECGGELVDVVELAVDETQPLSDGDYTLSILSPRELNDATGIRDLVGNPLDPLPHGVTIFL